MSVQQPNCWTNIQKNKKRCHNEQLKRSPDKTHERPSRPNNTPVPQRTTHARIPDNNENPQNLRSILWTKHNLPLARNTRKERIRQERLGNVNRKTKKGLQTHNRGTKPAELHGRLSDIHMQTNWNTKCSKGQPSGSRSQTFCSASTYEKDRNTGSNNLNPSVLRFFHSKVGEGLNEQNVPKRFQAQFLLVSHILLYCQSLS